MANVEAPAAPKALHDLLDQAFPLLSHMQRLQMSSQLILFWGEDGRPGDFKVSATGKAKKG